MKKVATPLEILGCVLILILGLFLLYDGTINQAAAILIGGAICLPLGFSLLVPAVRNFRWHRQMLRDSSLDQKTNILSIPISFGFKNASTQTSRLPVSHN